MIWLLPLAGAAAALFLSGCGDESEERPVPTIPDASPPPHYPDAGSSDAGLPPPQFLMERVNLGPGGIQANGWSRYPSISADARFVAFESDAANLVADDTNGVFDIFVRDRQNGTTERISVGSGGVQSNGGSSNAVISADGRYVAFESAASNLVPGDTNGYRDIFVRDRLTGTTERISIGAGGVQSNWDCFSPSISGNGRFVAFSSKASSLMGGTGLNTIEHIFVRDRQDSTLTQITSGANASSFLPSLSSAGSYLVFSSEATNLIAGPGVVINSAVNVYLFREGEGIQLISRSSATHSGDGPSGEGRISGNGIQIVFSSQATNLPFAPNSSGIRSIFRSIMPSGYLSDIDYSGINVPNPSGESSSPSLSYNGSLIVFSSLKNYLVLDDTNNSTDVFLRNPPSTLRRISVGEANTQANSSSFNPVISEDGHFAAFSSFASNLIPGDTNDAPDIFVVGLDYFNTP